jgi:hypothetical protein
MISLWVSKVDDMPAVEPSFLGYATRALNVSIIGGNLCAEVLASVYFLRSDDG